MYAFVTLECRESSPITALLTAPLARIVEQHVARVQSAGGWLFVLNKDGLIYYQQLRLPHIRAHLPQGLSTNLVSIPSIRTLAKTQMPLSISVLASNERNECFVQLSTTSARLVP